MNERSKSLAVVQSAQPTTRLRFDDDQRRLIKDTCANGATDSEFAALVALAEERGLNPLHGECYFVKRYDKSRAREVWAIQASIDSFRIKAEETGLYAGQDEPEYEYNDPERKSLRLARVRVYRKDWGDRPAVGVAHYAEYVQTTKDGQPTQFWRTKAHVMLSKCAESIALRKAFPTRLAKVYTAEEMDQAEGQDVVEAAPRAKTLTAVKAPALVQAIPIDQDASLKACQDFEVELRAVLEAPDYKTAMDMLTKIAADVSNARRDNRITQEQRNALAKVYAEIRKDLNEPKDGDIF